MIVTICAALFPPTHPPLKISCVRALSDFFSLFFVFFCILSTILENQINHQNTD